MSETEGLKTAADPTADGGGAWIEERLALGSLDYEIPKHANHWTHMLGGLTAFFIVILILTGVYMGQFYNPTPLGAHDSVMYLIARAPLGDWVRSLHYWSTGAVVLTVTAHLVCVLWRRSYRKPREVTWWAGVAMAALIFLLLVTGTALRYDQEGFEALAHFVAGGNLTGALGAFFTEGFTRSTTLLSRIFSLHTSLLPLVLLSLMALHFWLIRHLGIRSEGRGETSQFRTHATRLGSISLLAFAAVGLLAVIVPEGLGYPPVAGVEMTKPMWPVLWVYGLENLLGAWGMVIGPSLLLGYLAVVPIVDRGAAGRRVVSWVGIVLGVAVLGLWLFGRFGAAQQHIGM